ncbi:MAG: hypothetical protein RDV41_11495 [Planctomycetota bacterium]|nr:hypothetical protein [Planctomycetota bacterium]
MSTRDERAKEFFTRNNARLRRIERVLVLVLVLAWLSALVADSIATLDHISEPLEEGNEALSALMTRFGIHNAICIGIACHFLYAGLWAGVCWLLNMLSVWRFKVAIPLVRVVPLCMFLLRSTGEHIYGVTTWL